MGSVCYLLAWPYTLPPRRSRISEVFRTRLMLPSQTPPILTMKTSTMMTPSSGRGLVVVEGSCRRQDLSHSVEVLLVMARKTSSVKVSAVAVDSCRHKVPLLSVGVRLVMVRKINTLHHQRSKSEMLGGRPLL